MKKQDKIFPDFEKNYLLLYEKTAKENKELREKINYPKVEITSYIEPFGKEQFIAEFPLGNCEIFHVIKEVDAIICEKDEKYRQYIIDNMLRELGYRYFKRAYDYWQTKDKEFKDE